MQRLLFEKHYDGDGLEESNRLSLFAMAVLVFVVVTGIGYATYLFIDASRISDIAGVHITKNFSLVFNDLQGKLYTDESRGIKNWMIHTDKANGFELKHPNDWKMQVVKKDGNFLLLKTYKKSEDRSLSLLMTVKVRGNDEANEKKSLRAIIKEEGFVWQENWKKQELDGRLATRTGKTKTVDGLLKDAVFLTTTAGSKGFYLEATYYTDNYNDAKYNEEVFNKVIAEFRFL